MDQTTEMSNQMSFVNADDVVAGKADRAVAGTMDKTETKMDAVNAIFPNMNNEMDLDDYEIVGAEFFAQIKEPAFTVNVNKVTVNAAGVRLLPDVDYVKILIKRDEKKLVLKPCAENDIYGYKWARDKDGKRYASQRTGEPFVLILCGIMGWNPDNRYKILGKRMYSKGEAILVFDLTVAQCFEKAPVGEDGKPVRRSTALPASWNGRFGPTYGENRRTLQVDTFEGYSVISIKGKSSAADKDGAVQEGDNLGDTDATAVADVSPIVGDVEAVIPVADAAEGNVNDEAGADGANTTTDDADGNTENETMKNETITSGGQL